MMKRVWALLLVLWLPFTGCGSDGDGESVGGDTSTPATADVETTSSTAAPDAAPGGIEVMPDIRFAGSDAAPLLLDILRPPGEGPFPVVVAYHGNPGSKDDSAVREPATRLAEAGFLVFVPTWNTTAGQPSVDEYRAAMDQGACALAVAQSLAAEHGGDVTALATMGGSAGAHPAARQALGHLETSDECEVSSTPTVPNGAVLIDSEYFHHSTYFQPMFDETLVDAQALVSEFIDESTWSVADGATFRLSAASDQTVGLARAVESPLETSWLAQRDVDGRLITDLTDLGALEDDLVDYIDSSQLLEQRLRQAGLDVTYETHEGNHLQVIKNIDTDYLVDAARSATGSE